MLFVGVEPTFLLKINSKFTVSTNSTKKAFLPTTGFEPILILWKNIVFPIKLNG